LTAAIKSFLSRIRGKFDTVLTNTLNASVEIMQCGQTACVYFIREFACRTSAAFKDHYDQGRQFRQTWSDPLSEYASLGSGLVGWSWPMVNCVWKSTRLITTRNHVRRVFSVKTLPPCSCRVACIIFSCVYERQETSQVVGRQRRRDRGSTCRPSAAAVTPLNFSRRPRSSP